MIEGMKMERNAQVCATTPVLDAIRADVTVHLWTITFCLPLATEVARAFDLALFGSVAVRGGVECM